MQGTLLLHCDDQAGIVSSVSACLYEHDVNIISSQQHREELNNQFFMRVHFDSSGSDSNRSDLAQSLSKVAEQFLMNHRLRWSSERRKMAIMVSKTDHCLVELFQRHRYGELPVDIPLVISNHAVLEEVASHYGAAFVHLPVNRDNRDEMEKRMLALYQEFEIDFIVLARYMQIVGSTLLEVWPDQIINIHHGFLPAFKGAKPYHQAYERGVKIVGATSHYVTTELDDGPIIAQDTVAIDHTHSVSDTLMMGRDLERTVLADAVKAHVTDRVLVVGKRTVVFR